jgi:hypothetical protein
MNEAMEPIDPIHSAMMLGMTPEPCEPIIEITRQALTKLLDVVEFGDQLERVEKDRLVAFVKEILAEAQPELWAMHSVGPNEVHPMISKEEAERQAASLIALCKERFPDIPITVNVIPSPYSPFEHFEILSQELTEQVASLHQAVATGSTPAPVGAMPPEIPRHLLGKIVDELFGGAIEDTSAIEDVYRVIARELHAVPVVNQQLTTAQCIWKRDWETGAYELGCCGQAWHFTDGTAEENGALYCHHCAGEIVVDQQTLIAYQVGDNDIVAAYDPAGAIQVLVDFAGYGDDFDVEPVSDKVLDATEAFDQDEGKIIPLEKTLRQQLAELTEPAYLHGWE